MPQFPQLYGGDIRSTPSSGIKWKLRRKEALPLASSPGARVAALPSIPEFSLNLSSLPGLSQGRTSPSFDAMLQDRLVLPGEPPSLSPAPCSLICQQICFCLKEGKQDSHQNACGQLSRGSGTQGQASEESHASHICLRSVVWEAGLSGRHPACPQPRGPCPLGRAPM